MLSELIKLIQLVAFRRKECQIIINFDGEYFNWEYIQPELKSDELRPIQEKHFVRSKPIKKLIS